MNDDLWRRVLNRVLDLLPDEERLDWQRDRAAVWRDDRWRGRFVGHASIDPVSLQDLLHLDHQKATLVQNTRQFVQGLPANNALLWGARGTGKSSLVHAVLNDFADDGLRLVEVRKEELAALADIVERLVAQPYRFIVFCDDLSFEAGEASYKELKSALEGSIFRTAGNVLIYATSNRRHLLPEYMSDNQQTRVGEVGELHEGEVVEEKISLSDRFGLWLSFYAFRQDAYLDVVRHWVGALATAHDANLDLDDETMRAEALRWALARGARNGRVAQHFARHWVGQRLLGAGA